MTWGSAPGYWKTTWIVGKSTVGSAETGRNLYPNEPIKTIPNIRSDVAIGRRINGSETFTAFCETLAGGNLWPSRRSRQAEGGIAHPQLSGLPLASLTRQASDCPLLTQPSPGASQPCCLDLTSRRTFRRGPRCTARSRNRHRVGFRAQKQANIDELPRPEAQVGIVESRLKLDGSGSGIDLIVEHGQRAVSKGRGIVTIECDHLERLFCCKASRTSQLLWGSVKSTEMGCT